MIWKLVRKVKLKRVLKKLKFQVNNGKLLTKNLLIIYKWYKRGYNNQKITYFTGNVTTNINGEIKVKKYTKKHPYEVKKDGKFHVTHKKDWSDYVLPSTDCQSDNKEIIKKAKAITKGKKSNRDKANAILKWVQEHKGYDDYLNTFYGAVKSLSTKKLNCQDSALLTAAEFQALQAVPARETAAASCPARYSAARRAEPFRPFPKPSNMRPTTAPPSFPALSAPPNLLLLITPITMREAGRKWMPSIISRRAKTIPS